MREWLWIAIALVAGTMLLQPAADLGGLTIRAAGAFFAGAYVALTLAGPLPRSLFVRTAIAVTAAAAATAGWFVALGLRYTELRDAVVATQWKAYRTFLKGLPEVPPPSVDDVVAGTPTAELARDLSRTVHLVGDLFPALLALSALAAGWLVWVWYHRVARQPIGNASTAFRNFRFTDHLIWVLLALGGLTLAELPGALDLISLNLLVVILGIYGARGLAVARTMLLRTAPFITPLLCLIALPVLPLPLSGLVILGVADTWLDLRRRLPPPEGVIQ